MRNAGVFRFEWFWDFISYCNAAVRFQSNILDYVINNCHQLLNCKVFEPIGNNRFYRKYFEKPSTCSVFNRDAEYSSISISILLLLPTFLYRIETSMTSLSCAVPSPKRFPCIRAGKWIYMPFRMITGIDIWYVDILLC